MKIKFFKKSLSIIFIMTIIIASMMISKSEAVETLESGKTLLDYVDVDVVPEKGKELKIMLPNYDKAVIAKVKVLPTGKELKIMQDKTSKKYYVTYTGEAGKITLEFYKKDAPKPYVSKQMEIKKEQDGTYSVIVAPKITYSTESDNDRAFKITDAKGISEIVICKRNAKGKYDYKEENIIYKNNVKEDTRINPHYINTQLEKLGTKAPIKIKRLDEYGYYEIKVTGISGLMHTREVKVRGKMKTAKPTAKTENGFAPSIKVEKNNKNKLTFKIDKANKVTSAKMYQVIDGKVNSKEVKLEDMKKTGDYITSFTFAKEGMYRLKLLNKSGESAASITDFIINRKDNTETWRINESPRVEKSTGEKNMQKIKISDGAIKSIKIFVKGSNGYDLTKPIYKYENGQVKETTAQYIDESNSSYKDKNNIYIALKRSTSAMTKYLIQVTDQGGSDPELIKNRLIHVDKTATEVEKKDTSKSSEKTVKKDTSKKNTNSSNTKKVNKNDKQTTQQKNTTEQKKADSNSKTKKVTNSKTVFGKIYNGNTIAISDADGIKKIETNHNDRVWYSKTNNSVKLSVNRLEGKSYNLKVTITDKKGKKSSKTYTIKGTAITPKKQNQYKTDIKIRTSEIYVYDENKIYYIEIRDESGLLVESTKYNLNKKSYTFKNIYKKTVGGGTYKVSVRDCLGNVQSKTFTRTRTGKLQEIK